eukprot:TRINITY_DN1151_c0_g1_i3.p1 TRINITY_DN1151_c0_g1~~TRINITY_DN1151_c0_g1_i3.p1  ORF type:complete len:262 (+),score=64.31 TRINITY_DN1151_c0_g1_i3:362-1147(+)
MGMVDVLLLLQNIIQQLYQDEQFSQASDQDRATKFAGAAHKFLSTEVYHIANSMNVGFLVKSQESQRLVQVIKEGFLAPHASNKHIHRVAVFDKHGRVSDLLSQTDIIRYLSQRPRYLGDLASKTLGQLGLAQKHVYSVQKSVRAIAAFKQMLDLQVSALAVVDGEVLVGNLSASDLRGITEQTFDRLALTVEQFILATRFEGATELPSPLACSANTAFLDVVQTLSESGRHRIYVIDAQRRPVGLVTLTDLLMAISHLHH